MNWIILVKWWMGMSVLGVLFVVGGQRWHRQEPRA